MNNALTLNVLEALADDLRRLKAENEPAEPTRTPALTRIVSLLAAATTAFLAG